jgi:hypothetical protein
MLRLPLLSKCPSTPLSHFAVESKRKSCIARIVADHLSRFPNASPRYSAQTIAVRIGGNTTATNWRERHIIT